ncbi:hypothetical protein B0H12DRAFT_1118939 [Mycena haematopus]|nr:hypothetical protein B0H12DRAFT_1118939 [Mycena haematopus]
MVPTVQPPLVSSLLLLAAFAQGIIFCSPQQVQARRRDRPSVPHCSCMLRDPDQPRLEAGLV